jgi:hypothetical protein
MLCCWCDDAATVYLVSDADSRNPAHPACDAHESMWGKLYRRSVSISRRALIDLRETPGDHDRRRGVSATGDASRSTVA